jgi:hypothetical protein
MLLLTDRLEVIGTWLAGTWLGGDWQGEAMFGVGGGDERG